MNVDPSSPLSSNEQVAQYGNPPGALRHAPHPRSSKQWPSSSCSNKYFPQPEPIPALKTEVQGDCLFIHLHDIIIDWH
jgi:hypothetical protein